VNDSSWSSTFERFPTGTSHLLGSIAVDVHDWSRPQAGEPRLFREGPLEWFTCAHPAALVALYVPGGLWLTWIGLRAGDSAALAGLLYVAGLVFWTLLEYGLHRYSFHHVPRTSRQVAFGYLIHGVHHAYPDDSRRWVMPPVVSLPTILVLAGAAWLLFGLEALPFIGGGVHGYLIYDTTHYLIHRGSMRSRLGRYLRRHHLQHHHAVPECNFGVSSPIWDFIFHTAR